MVAILKALGLAILSFLVPIKALMLTVGFLVFADLITGILAARVTKTPLSSAGFRRTIVKMTAYQIAVISGYVLGKYILEDFDYIAKIVAASISVTEFKSMSENIQLATGKNIVKAITEAFWSSNDEGPRK